MTGQWETDFLITEDEYLDPDSMTEYSIQELRDFFGEQGYLYYFQLKHDEGPVAWEHRKVYYVNEHFPVENMRHHTWSMKDGEKEYSWDYYYTLYKVKEGGYYRVEWSLQGNMIYSYGGIYTKSNLTEKDFAGVQEGMILKDVLKTDPYLFYLESNYSAESYSLLSNGKVMYVTYIIDINIDEFLKEMEENERGLLYASRVETKTVENLVDTPGYELAQMLPQDIELCFGE
jgi:hypothetical protein